MRLRTDAKKRRGSLFTNPGGPGVSGTGEFHRERSLDIMEQSGGYYDIISWDLRGINDTFPAAKCFQSQQLADNFWAGSLWYEGSEFDLQGFYARVESEDVKMRAFWEQCAKMSGDILPYLGTAATARDVASMVDAIDGTDSDINYCFVNYPSLLRTPILLIVDLRLYALLVVEIFLALMAPRSKWQPLARYLKAQDDLINAKSDGEKASILQAWSITNQKMGLADTLDRHELKQFWDFDFLYAHRV
ncbi:hypothetical protein HWV62_592 [Athelia sp. TMB]|nr:hypothetical protein HWV62_592 [Athelia sp. TMB]